MKTKITLLGLAIATIFSSCSKETFTMSSNTGGYGAYHKTAKQEAAKPNAANPEMAEPVLTASAEITPAVISNTSSFSAPKATETKAAATETSLEKVPAISKKEMKAAVKAAKKELKKDTKDTNAEGKNQIVAALLAFFLGLLGIHRFYLGYTGIGIAQLLITVLLGWLIIPLVVVFIWVLIDLVRILTGSLKPKDGEYGKTI